MNKHIGLLLSLSFWILIAGCDDTKQGSNTQAKQLDNIARLYHSGKIDACLEEAELFVSSYPNNDAGWHLLSSAYLSKGKDSLVEVCARKALSLNPKNHIALLNVGILLDKQKKYEEAKIYYLKSIGSNPNLPQTYSNYVGNRLIVGDYQVAVIYGEKVVKMVNNIKDKGILCLSYHKAGMLAKRDSLYTELEKLGYQNVDDLKEIFNN